jgi:stage V sporulation protein G
MEITRVNVTIVDQDKVKAYADIVLDDCFLIRGLKLIYTNRFFISMPSRKRKDGSFSDIAFPVNEKIRKTIELKILEAYEKQDKLE